MNAATAFDLHLIILAGGSSTRARRGKASAPKQFRRVSGQMLLLVSVRELLRLPEVVSLTITVPEPYRAIVDSALQEMGVAVPVLLANAGESRTASTWNAAQQLAESRSPRPDPCGASGSRGSASRSESSASG